MDSSDDDDDDDTNLVYTRAHRQLKKFAYADPCEVGCVTKKLHTKVPIKLLAVSCFFCNQTKLKLNIFHLETM